MIRFITAFYGLKFSEIFPDLYNSYPISVHFTLSSGRFCIFYGFLIIEFCISIHLWLILIMDQFDKNLPRLSLPRFRLEEVASLSELLYQ